MNSRKTHILNFINDHLGIVLFLFMGTIALFTFDEHGMGWDEVIQRKTGLLNYNYIFSGNDELLRSKDKDYGVAFEVPLIIIEKTLRMTDTRSVYLMRHLITHFFFLLGALFIFKLALFLYKNKIVATIAFLMIVLHPRLYAHSFINTKDIPFLSMFIVSLYYMAVAFKNKTLLNFTILGFSFGILINLRIMGVLLPSAALLFLLIDALKDKTYLLHLKLTVTLLLSAVLLLILTWPFLWSDPFGNFIAAFKSMSNFKWSNWVLLGGELIRGNNIPWYYIPLWFSISTPLIYLFAGLLGSIILLLQSIKRPIYFFSNSMERNNILYLASFILPVLVVIIMNSTLYDGWRQLYFIYPSFVLIGLYGMNYLIQQNKKQIVLILAAVSFVSVSIFMILNAPFQQVYFNELLSFKSDEYIRKNFDFDYWGASYKQSLEYILDNDETEVISIAVANNPGIYNLNILKPEDRKRVIIVPLEEASYFITEYRFHPQDYDELQGMEFHSFKVGNNTVSQIFKVVNN